MAPKPLESLRRVIKCVMALKRPHPRFRRPLSRQPIAERQAEGFGLDFEDVAFLRLHPVAKRQRRGAEEMDMDVARPAEQAILEMMRLEIGDRMRHVLF